MLNIHTTSKDVDKAANYLITHHHGKSKNRIEEVDKGKEYTLLVHKLSPEAIMIATDEVEIPSVLTEYEFWKQKDRDDLLIDDLSKLSLYQVHIICKDGERAFKCSRSLNHPFTKLEGSVALLRAQKVLGKPQAKYGHTYNLSNMNHGEVRDILAKAGFFAGEYNTAASNEMRSDRLKWGSCLDNGNDTNLRDKLYKDTRNEMARKATEWDESQGRTQNLNNPNSSNVGDVFLSDTEMQMYPEFSKTKAGPSIKEDGRPVYHTGHNSIPQGSHCFFNKHDVEAKTVPFWPGVLGWYNSLTAAEKAQVDLCQGRACLTPNRLFRHDHKYPPISPHLEADDYEDEAAWAHTNAATSMLFHLFHGQRRYDNYGRIGAPYGDEFDLYQLLPRDCTCMNQFGWGMRNGYHMNLGRTVLPVPIHAAWKVYFNDLNNPTLPNTTIIKYWDNYDYCEPEVIPFANL